MPTPLRVLILEDEPADAELMAQELRRAGFDPAWERVATETEYLALLDPALDLILADYRLPQFDGLLALKLLQERGLDIPFILVSATIGEELAVSAMKQGATDYLLKDRLARLGQAVAHALEQRRLRSEGKQAEAASRHKSAFLANMSHELRTPLNAILGFSELLAQQTYGPLTEKQARYVASIHSGGEHLLALINDLLDLSKVEAGRIELQPQPFFLPEALQAALYVIRRQAEVKGLQLSLSIDEGLSMLTADPIRFNQILYNLLSNAVKFTPDNGRIAVTAKRGSRGDGLGSSEASPQDVKPHTLPPGDYVEIAVADTGIGIKPEDLSKLFQRFTQLKHMTTKQHQGVGLGLALTKQLVELHGGTIRVHSDGEGRGSTFTVCLPLAELQAVPQLLVVDDDKNLLEAIRDALEAAGYQVKTAEDGAAALAQVEAARLDLLILDLGLPVVDGWEVLRRVRAGAATRALPVLAITGVEVERSDQVLAAGADEFLSKPFSLTVLEDTVRRILLQGVSAEHPRGRQMHRLNLVREPTMKAGAPKGAKILVVEDQPLGRMLVVDLLAAEGYTVLQAEDGAGVLERVKRERPDLILLDLHLPEIDGLTLARHLKANPETQSIPLLAITACAQPEDHAKALAAGFADYLTKPLDTERFIQTVGRVLGR